MKLKIALSLATLAVLAGCATPAAGPRAAATLSPTAGNSTSGSIRFEGHGQRVRVHGEVRGLKPNAEHGFHLHERGDCSAPDGTSAGGHFNPHGHAHGRHGGGAHHAGDLPSLKSDANGVARFDFETSTLSLGAGPADVVGKGVVVHRDADDFRSQPAGNSGARIACGVVVKS